MKFYVVGYEWCPHYQNVLAMCRNAHLKHTPIVVGNHEELMNAINRLLESYKRIGQPAETSPKLYYTDKPFVFQEKMHLKKQHSIHN